MYDMACKQMQMFVLDKTHPEGDNNVEY